MNLSTGETPDVVLLTEDHTVIISNKDAVIFKCTRCGGTKDAFSHDAKRDLEWMQSCTCKRRSPYDTIPLSPDMLPPDVRPGMQPFDLPADVLPPYTARAVFRFVERDEV